MTADLRPPTRFDSHVHDPSRFACGVAALDGWLRRAAGQSQRRDAVRTFVIATATDEVVGYYTLVAAQLDHELATDDVGRGLSRHFPIPVALIARLAVDREHQGRGLGALLLRDALRRIVGASRHVAMRAVVVHATDARAASFYERFGFRGLSAAPRTLMVTLAELRAAGVG